MTRWLVPCLGRLPGMLGWHGHDPISLEARLNPIQKNPCITSPIRTACPALLVVRSIALSQSLEPS
jgi:hypothetical protein